MVLICSQETFDGVVQENVELLGLSHEEAVEEAVKQLESEGADLSQIVKDPMDNQKPEAAAIAVRNVEQLIKSRAKPESVVEALESLRGECEKGVQHRVAAGNANAYSILLDTYEQYTGKDVQISALKALISLMTKQPDLLDQRGITFIVTCLKESPPNYDILKFVLKWTKECCVMHEQNRQNIFDSKILDSLKNFLKENCPLDIIKETLAVSRALVLDDDVRVEFGRAHEHARIIASETLCAVISLLTKFKSDETLIFEILNTITALMVRAEFCQKVEDAGGVELLKTVMKNFEQNDKIARQCFKLAKALAGHDACKASIITKYRFAPVICSAVAANMESAATVTAGLSAIAALTLRSPQNSQALCEARVAEIIIDSMKRHSDNKQVQKTGSWAIRNMVSRSKALVKPFLDLDVEGILQEDLKRFKDIEYDIKAALRDLGCKVQLKEEWTGKGGKLTSGISPQN